jgi:hypothetical protein
MICKEKSNFFTKLSSYVKKNGKTLHSDYGILEIPAAAGRRNRVEIPAAAGRYVK